MAARKTRGTLANPWDDTVRTKIKTSMLIKRLSDHIVNPKETEVSQTQLKAIEILLRKSLPDLSAVTLEGGDKPIQHVITWDESSE